MKIAVLIHPAQETHQDKKRLNVPWLFPDWLRTSSFLAPGASLSCTYRALSPTRLWGGSERLHPTDLLLPLLLTLQHYLKLRVH